MPDFLLALGISVAVNLFFFAIAAWRKTDTVTDLSYGLSFVAVTAAMVAIKEVREPLRLAVALFVLAWALRLAAHLFRRILAVKVDHRFDGRREKITKFAAFWALQALSVAVVMLPALGVLSSPPPRPSAFHAAGAAVWLSGFAVETISDSQKWRWKRSGDEGFIRSGLWSWSRHPNYFGEMLLWWGIWVFALPSLSGWGHLAVLGPLHITWLLVALTGIPPLERRAQARFGDDPAYLEYKRRTSILVPLPPREGRGSES